MIVKYGESEIVVRNCMERYQIKVMSMIRTERLTIYSASQEQMEAMIASEQNEELKKAYTEMLEGCLRHPDQWDWYAMWMIEKTDGTHIGDLCFKGLREDGIAEIGYGILEAYQGQGYATEAAIAVLDFMFNEVEITDIRTSAAEINPGSWKLMEKLGFEFIGTKKSTYYKGDEILVLKRYHGNKELFLNRDNNHKKIR